MNIGGYLGNVFLLHGDPNHHIPPNVLMVGPHWRFMFATIGIISIINFIIIGIWYIILIIYKFKV